MIYLDYQATTPVDPRVVDVVVAAMTDAFGNASSRDHGIGDRAASLVESAAKEVAALVGAKPAEVVFTSGATEALNLAIRGHLVALEAERPVIAVSPLEHPAALDTCRQLAREGLADLRFLKVDRYGLVDVEDVERTCHEGAVMVVAMAANNEIGTIAPWEAIAEVCRDAGVTYVCDGTQAAGKVAIDVGAHEVPLFALSGHKLYGPQGVGALIVRRGTLIRPLFSGGSQQRGLRPGTLNVPGIAGFGEACRLRRLEMEVDEPRIARLRDRFEQAVLTALPDATVNGALAHRLAGNSHISVKGVPNDAVIAHVRERLAISTGAACSSGIEAPSHVLQALGLPQDVLEGSFRFGFGRVTTEVEVDEAASIFVAAVRSVRSRLSFA